MKHLLIIVITIFIIMIIVVIKYTSDLFTDVAFYKLEQVKVHSKKLYF